MSAKVYVGNIPPDSTEKEIDSLFHKFGRIEQVWLAKNPPGLLLCVVLLSGFAFVTFQDERDAEEAIRAMDGKNELGRTIKVEMSRGPRSDRRRRDDYRDRDRDRGRFSDRDRYRDSYRGRSRSRDGYRYRYDREPPRRRGRFPEGYRHGEFRVNIKGLAPRTRWEELKDWLRTGGEVCFTNVMGEEAVADFLTSKDRETAIKKLDGTEWNGSKVYIEEYQEGGKRERSRSRSRGRSRSRSREKRRKTDSRSQER
eukprot:maker-scaffold_35-snap-gene-1.55-mRNA-1 protein AED:0.21 eAED:0.21 QI:102/1/1/1/0.4/0/6/765/254